MIMNVVVVSILSCLATTLSNISIKHEKSFLDSFEGIQNPICSYEFNNFYIRIIQVTIKTFFIIAFVQNDMLSWKLSCLATMFSYIRINPEMSSH